MRGRDCRYASASAILQFNVVAYTRGMHGGIFFLFSQVYHLRLTEKLAMREDLGGIVNCNIPSLH